MYADICTSLHHGMVQHMEWFKYSDIIAKYIQAIYRDGDYGNDWLTHMSPQLAAFMRDYGMMLAASLGF
jgi:hypothetical protein